MIAEGSRLYLALRGHLALKVARILGSTVGGAPPLMSTPPFVLANARHGSTSVWTNRYGRAGI